VGTGDVLSLLHEIAQQATTIEKHLVKERRDIRHNCRVEPLVYNADYRWASCIRRSVFALTSLRPD